MGKLLSRATGADAIRTAVASTAGQAAEVAGALRDMGRRLAAPSPSAEIPANLTDPAERFAAAARHFRLRPADIARRQREEWGRWACWLLVLVAVGAYAIVSGSLAPLAVAPAVAAMVLKAAFGHWQLRTRRLGSLREFLRQPWEWWPLSGGGAAVAVLVALVAVAAPDAAHAGLLPAAPGDSDLATQFLRALVSEEMTPWGAALFIFSTYLTAVASSMLAFHTVVGVAQTAHEGKVLGQRWNLMWAPIRVCIGMGLLVPMSNTGLSGGHYLVGHVAAMGSGMASEVWTGFVEVVAQGGSVNENPKVAAIGLPSPVGGMVLARRVLDAEVCVAGLARDAANVGVWTETLWGAPTVPPLPVSTGTPAGDRTAWSYGDCGGLAVPAGGEGAEQAYNAARAAAVAAVIDAVRASGLPQQIAEGVSPGGAIPWPTGIVAKLAPAGAAYEQALRAAARAYVQERDKGLRDRLVEHARLNGWMSAGSYWRTLSDMSGQVTALASVPPEFTAPNVDDDGLAAEALAKLAEAWKGETKVDRLTGAELGQPGDKDADWLTQLLGPVSKTIAEWSVAAAGTEAADPMRSLMSFGHGLLTAAWGAIAVGAVVAVAAFNIAADAAGADGAFLWAALWAVPLLATVIVIGWTHAYLLPMTPFIAVLWLVVGWLVFFIEAMIAVPILAFMFIRLDGTEFIDQVQKPGIILLFNFFLRPSIGILGLCGAYFILPLAMGMLNLWLPAAFAGQQGGHVVGLLGWIGGAGLACYLQYQVCIRVLALISEAPDRVARWFGASAEGLGEQKSTENNMAAVGAAVGNVAKSAGSPAEKMARQGGGGGASKLPGGAGAGRDHWANQTGGYDSLSTSQQQAAQKAYGEWAKENPGPASKYGLADYTSYVQKQNAKRSGAGGEG